MCTMEIGEKTAWMNAILALKGMDVPFNAGAKQLEGTAQLETPMPKVSSFDV